MNGDLCVLRACKDHASDIFILTGLTDSLRQAREVILSVWSATNDTATKKVQSFSKETAWSILAHRGNHLSFALTFLPGVLSGGRCECIDRVKYTNSDTFAKEGHSCIGQIDRNGIREREDTSSRFDRSVEKLKLVLGVCQNGIKDSA